MSSDLSLSRFTETSVIFKKLSWTRFSEQLAQIQTVILICRSFFYCSNLNLNFRFLILKANPALRDTIGSAVTLLLKLICFFNISGFMSEDLRSLFFQKQNNLINYAQFNLNEFPQIFYGKTLWTFLTGVTERVFVFFAFS